LPLRGTGLGFGGRIGGRTPEPSSGDAEPLSRKRVCLAGDGAGEGRSEMVGVPGVLGSGGMANDSGSIEMPESERGCNDESGTESE